MTKDTLKTPDHAPNVLEFAVGNDSMQIERFGARLSLRLDGQQILTGADAVRGDGNRAVTHICTPNFGDFGKAYGLKQHGTARNSNWETIFSNQGKSRAHATLHYDIQGGTYPLGVSVDQEFILTNGEFTLITRHKNNGLEPAPVVWGEHFYWAAPDWTDVLLNGQPIGANIAGNSSVDLLPSNEFIIPSHAVIRLEQEGMPMAVTWVRPGDTGYFCLEPVEADPATFGEKESMLHAGSIKTSVIRISLVESLKT